MIVTGVLAGMIAFGTAPAPQALATVTDPFKHIDYSGLPAIETYRARDGAMLAYRSYAGDGKRVAVLIHGSSGNSISMHALAKALNAAGMTIYVLDMRGHGASGRRGDIDYAGQLDDDVMDFVKFFRLPRRDATATLVGFSSGAGFALRFAGGADGSLFDRYLLISPALYYTSPTNRPDAGGWAAVYLPRIVALSIVSGLGIHWFDGLPVIRFAVPPEMEGSLTATYSARLLANFGSGEHYLDAIRKTSKPIAVLIGGADEILYPERFPPLFHSVRPGIEVTVVGRVSHTGMITTQPALEAIKAALAD
jgi:non-heme chloroperoxidase